MANKFVPRKIYKQPFTVQYSGADNYRRVDSTVTTAGLEDLVVVDDNGQTPAIMVNNYIYGMYELGGFSKMKYSGELSIIVDSGIESLQAAYVDSYIYAYDNLGYVYKFNLNLDEILKSQINPVGNLHFGYDYIYTFVYDSVVDDYVVATVDYNLNLVGKEYVADYLKILDAGDAAYLIASTNDSYISNTVYLYSVNDGYATKLTTFDIGGNISKNSSHGFLWGDRIFMLINWDNTNTGTGISLLYYDLNTGAINNFYNNNTLSTRFTWCLGWDGKIYVPFTDGSTNSILVFDYDGNLLDTFDLGVSLSYPALSVNHNYLFLSNNWSDYYVLDKNTGEIVYSKTGAVSSSLEVMYIPNTNYVVASVNPSF